MSWRTSGTVGRWERGARNHGTVVRGLAWFCASTHALES